MSDGQRRPRAVERLIAKFRPQTCEFQKLSSLHGEPCLQGLIMPQYLAPDQNPSPQHRVLSAKLRKW
jgi:hypothetical protein